MTTPSPTRVAIRYLESASCPVRTEHYGGLPSDGGLDRNKEFGVGLAEIFEAAHCILGSLGNHVGKGRNDWQSMVKTEAGHLQEEADIIRKSLSEYSKPVYRRDMVDFEQYMPKYRDQVRESAKKQVQSIRQQCPKLEALARSKGNDFLNALQNEEPMPPEPWFNSVVGAYAVVTKLCKAAVNSVENWPESLGDPFSDPEVRKALSFLDRNLAVLYRITP